MTFNQVTENAIKFSFQPNSRKIIKIFFCILPAILLFSLTHSEFWLISLLVSVFLIIPYENKSFTYFPVIHILFSISMFLLTILQMLILNAFIPYSFFLSIFGIIVATGILCFPRFKPFLIWLLIGSVYTAFHFHKDHIFELNKILLVFGIAFLSSFFSYFIFMQNKKSLLKFKLKIVTKKFLTNLKTQQQKLNFISILIHSLSFGAALFISSAILFYFGLEEGQW